LVFLQTLNDIFNHCSDENRNSLIYMA